MKGTILVVDDDASIRGLLRQLFEGDYEVLCAACGDEALKLLGNRNVDLVLLDYLLPDRDGIEVLEDVRRERPGTGVILITGYGTFDVACRALELGVEGLCGKPFDADRLKRKVEEYFKVRLDPGEVQDGAIARVLEYVRENLDGKLSLKDVLRVACLSRSAFWRRFKKSLGMSFREYVNLVRMERAKELLEDLDRSILQVSQEVGFCNPSYFARKFKVYTGFTPSEFRKRMGKSLR